MVNVTFGNKIVSKQRKLPVLCRGNQLLLNKKIYMYKLGIDLYSRIKFKMIELLKY